MQFLSLLEVKLSILAMPLKGFYIFSRSLFLERPIFLTMQLHMKYHLIHHKYHVMYLKIGATL